MGLLDEIESDDKQAPIRVVIYGEKGVGKSTFALHSPKPIFIDIEKGSRALRDKNGVKAKVFKNVNTFEDIRQKVQLLTNSPKEFETVVLDSADWAEQACHKEILGSSGKNINTVLGGYGAGRSESEARFRNLIGDLNSLQDKHAMNVIITAHAKVKTVKDPEAAQDYDAFEMKCDEKVTALLQEWADVVLFARFQTFVKVNDDAKVGRVVGSDKQQMFTTKSAGYFAKNRYGLPPKLEVDYDAFAQALRKAQGATVEDVLAELNELAPKLTDELRANMVKAIEAAKGNLKTLIGIRNYARTKAAA